MKASLRNFSKNSSVLVPWYQLFILQMMCAAIGVCIGGCLSSPGGSTDILPTTLHPPQLHLHILIRFNSISSSFHPSIFYARNKSPKLSFFSLSIPCEPYHSLQPNTNRSVPFWFQSLQRTKSDCLSCTCTSTLNDGENKNICTYLIQRALQVRRILCLLLCLSGSINSSVFSPRVWKDHKTSEEAHFRRRPSSSSAAFVTLLDSS